MGLLDLLFDSLPHAPGGGLGPGGFMLGGAPSIGGTAPGEDGPPEPDDQPFLNPERYKMQELLERYHHWLTSGSTTLVNAGRTTTALVGLPVLFLLFHAERAIRSPLL